MGKEQSISTGGKRFDIPSLVEGALMEFDGQVEQIFRLASSNWAYGVKYDVPVAYNFTGLRRESSEIIISRSFTLTRSPNMLIWDKPLEHRRGQSNMYDEYDRVLQSRVGEAA